MRNLYQIREKVVICSIRGELPTDAEVCLPVSCIIIGIEGSLTIHSSNGNAEAGNCFVILNDKKFKATPLDCKGFVILFFDAVSPEHSFLTSNFGGSDVTKIEWSGNEELLNKAFLKMDDNESDLFLDEVFKELFVKDRKKIIPRYDDRIVLIDEYIRKNISEKINNRDLAEKVFLSESRFYHFFKEQTHVNVSRYILWLRLKIIFERYFKNEGKLNTFLFLTNFTDLPHFIRSFKLFFGKSPKKLLNS